VQQNGLMRQRALQSVLLVHAIEQTDLAGDALSLSDRANASREALEGWASPADAGPAPINRDSERYLARRAAALLALLRVRSPGVDRVLAAAAGAPGLSRAMLVLAFLAGMAIAFADGNRIDIFAYPLIGLVIWNLVVYLILIVRLFAHDETSAATAQASPMTRGPTTGRLEGLIRRWLASLYAKSVQARIERLITHSIGFNAPLAPGLRRFAADWREVGRPLLQMRAARLLHLAAILAALGLMAGYDTRGWILRQLAGWGATVFGPASAHAALVVLYGAASAAANVPIPSAHALQALAWTGPESGGGSAGPWLYLIDWTALIYIVLPRSLAVILTTLALWRRAARLPTPPALTAYLTAVLRSATPPAASPQPRAGG